MDNQRIINTELRKIRSFFYAFFIKNGTDYWQYYTNCLFKEQIQADKEKKQKQPSFQNGCLNRIKQRFILKSTDYHS